MTGDYVWRQNALGKEVSGRYVLLPLSKRALYSEFCGHPITVLPTTPVAARIGRYALFEDEDDE